MKSIEANFEFPQGSRILICGSTNTGKSTLCSSLLMFNKELFKHPPKQIHYFFNVQQKLYQDIKSRLGNIKFHQGLDELTEVLDKPREFFEETPCGLVFDDLSEECFKSELVSKVFTRFAHHYGLSFVIIISQNPFAKEKYQTTINRNVSHLIITKSPRMRTVLKFLNLEIYPGKESGSLLQKIYDLAMNIDVEYPYLCCFLESRNDYTEFYSGILPGEKLISFVRNGTD